jgi:molybdopterin converting factor small subunit
MDPVVFRGIHIEQSKRSGMLEKTVPPNRTVLETIHEEMSDEEFELLLAGRGVVIHNGLTLHVDKWSTTVLSPGDSLTILPSLVGG